MPLGTRPQIQRESVADNMKRIEIDSFYEYASLSELALSPLGRTAAFLERRVREDREGYRAELRLMSVEGQEPPCSPLEEDTALFYWLNEKHLLYAPVLQENSLKKTTLLRCLDLETLSSRDTARLPGGVRILGLEGEDILLFTAETDLEVEACGDSEEALKTLGEERSRFTVIDECPFWYNARGVTNGIRNRLYRLDLKTGEYAPFLEEGYNIAQAAYDKSGGTVMFSAFYNMPVHRDKPGLYLYHLEVGHVDCLFGAGERRVYQIQAWNRAYLVTTGNDMPGNSRHTATRACLYDTEEGRMTVLHEDSPWIGNSVIGDCRMGGGRTLCLMGDELYFVLGREDASHIAVMNKKGEVTPVLEKDGSVDMLDVQNGKIVFVAMHDFHLQELFSLDEKTGTLRQLTHVNDAVHRKYEILPGERLFFRDKDGVEIHGFVIKPAGFDPEGTYPMILDIHGGPGLSYGEIFYHEMQYWAARGYFVAYSNPRGSAARGDAFHDLYGHFGCEDYENLMQFTDLVLEKYPQIDRKRMGVTGGSFGGFMTNWIIGHTNRFAAAVSQRSISNHITMHLVSDMTGYCTEEMTLYTPWENIGAVWEQSPLSHAMKAETPTLFLQSEQDYRCPGVEAIQMYAALCIKGIPARLCIFKNENHELSRNGHPKNRRKRLEEITEWMDRYTASGR